jgi:DNA-binding transcriptional LysR family regulator
VKQLRQGSLDAAVVSELLDSRSGLQWWPFAREPLVLIAPIDAPDISAEQLISTYPFVRYTRAAWVGELIDRFIKRRRLPVNEAMTLDTLEAITTMVHYGLGVSIVPLRLMGAPIELPVRRVAFEGTPVQRVIGLVQTTGHPKAALAEALLSELRTLAASAAAKPVATANGRKSMAKLSASNLPGPGRRERPKRRKDHKKR